MWKQSEHGQGDLEAVVAVECWLTSVNVEGFSDLSCVELVFSGQNLHFIHFECVSFVHHVFAELGCLRSVCSLKRFPRGLAVLPT